MKSFPHIFKRIGPQIAYFITVPAFFLFFVLFYKPQSTYDVFSIGNEGMEFNLIIATAIIFAVMVIFRLAFYFMRNLIHHNWGWYALWCFGEVLTCSMFVALFLYLMSDRLTTYFEFTYHVNGILFSTLIYPYLILTAILVIANSVRFPEQESGAAIRLYDENKKLKLVVSEGSLLYVEAQENYVRINYLDSDVLKEYLLRISMRKLESVMLQHGMVRCHRSYFINPKHVEILRKDRDGSIFAQFKNVDSVSIAVSKRYYDDLAKVL